MEKSGQVLWRLCPNRFRALVPLNLPDKFCWSLAKMRRIFGKALKAFGNLIRKTRRGLIIRDGGHRPIGHTFIMDAARLLLREFQVRNNSKSTMEQKALNLDLLENSHYARTRNAMPPREIHSRAQRSRKRNQCEGPSWDVPWKQGFACTVKTVCRKENPICLLLLYKSRKVDFVFFGHIVSQHANLR